MGHSRRAGILKAIRVRISGLSVTLFSLDVGFVFVLKNDLLLVRSVLGRADVRLIHPVSLLISVTLRGGPTLTLKAFLGIFPNNNLFLTPI